MSELDRGRKHNNSEEQILKVYNNNNNNFMFIMFVIIALYSNTPCTDISFLRKKKGYKKSEKYIGPVVIARSNNARFYAIGFRLSR